MKLLINYQIKIIHALRPQNTKLYGLFGPISITNELSQGKSLSLLTTCSIITIEILWDIYATSSIRRFISNTIIKRQKITWQVFSTVSLSTMCTSVASISLSRLDSFITQLFYSNTINHYLNHLIIIQNYEWNDRFHLNVNHYKIFSRKHNHKSDISLFMRYCCIQGHKLDNKHNRSVVKTKQVTVETNTVPKSAI